MDAFKHVEQEEAVEDNEVEFTHLDQPDNVRNGKPYGLAVPALLEDFSFASPTIHLAN